MERYRQEDMETIALHYGTDHQLRKLKEELEELLCATEHAIHCFNSEHLENIGNFIEEIADVEIVVTEVRCLLQITNEKLEKMEDAKIERQFERMEKEKRDEPWMKKEEALELLKMMEKIFYYWPPDKGKGEALHMAIRALEMNENEH